MPNNGISFAESHHPRQQDGQTGIVVSSFYPVVDLNAMRTAMRIDGTVTSEQLYQTAREAVSHVCRQLADFERQADKHKHAALSQTGEHNESRYQTAVYCYTKALLCERYADYDASGKTAARADAKQETAADYRRQGHHAVADILGRRRCDSELI